MVTCSHRASSQPHPRPHLLHSSSLVSPKKPQMSAPTMGMPHMLVLSRPWIDQRRFSQVAALSPVQCAPQRPRLGKEDLQVTAGVEELREVQRVAACDSV